MSTIHMRKAFQDELGALATCSGATLSYDHTPDGEMQVLTFSVDKPEPRSVVWRIAGGANPIDAARAAAQRYVRSVLKIK